MAAEDYDRKGPIFVRRKIPSVSVADLALHLTGRIITMSVS